MGSHLLHGFLERHAPVLEIEGGHVVVVEDPAACLWRRVQGRDDIVRVESLQVINDPVRGLEAMLDGGPVRSQSSQDQGSIRRQ